MDFWEEFIKSIVGYGVFAMLFVFLFFFQLKDSAKREASYRRTIEALTESLHTMNEIRDQMDQLIELMRRRENEKQI